MKNLTKKIEVAANVAIIVVAALLILVLVKHFILPSVVEPTPKPAPEIARGSKVSLSDVDWARSEQTLLLALSEGCRYCTESAPFYQKIAQARASQSNLRIIAVFPQPVSEAQKYLSSLGVSVDEVRQAPLDVLEVRGTPTLILVNREGIVKDVWTGKVPADKEPEVLSKL
jgi:thioredoxin-related protein